MLIVCYRQVIDRFKPFCTSSLKSTPKIKDFSGTP